MSGPVQTPLKVTEADGSPSGRPITEVIVSNGDLSISGVVATVDTTGAATSPATPANAIQFNSDPAGTFTGSSQLLYQTGSNQGRIEMSTGLVATQAEIRTMTGRGLQLSATDSDESIRTQVVLYGESDSVEGVGIIHGDSGYLWGYASGTSTPFDITTGGSASNLVLTTNNTEDKAKITLTAGADGDILIQTDNAGVLQLKNTTTDADSIFTVTGNGTGTPKVKLENGSMAVQTICEANKKFTVEGGNGGDTFVFDVSSSSGGITFPDSTVQTTAASGGSITANTMNIGALSTFTSEVRYEVSCMAPWSGEMGSSVVYNSVFWADQLFGYPFVAKVSGQLSELGVKFGSSSGGIEVAIYDSDDTTGLPTTLLGYGSMTYSAYAEVYDTSLTAPTTGSVGSLVAGSQYWCCYLRLVAGTGTLMACGTDANDRAASCQVTGPGDTDGGLFTTADYAAGDTFPDTLVMSNAVGTSYYVPKMTYKV